MTEEQLRYVAQLSQLFIFASHTGHIEATQIRPLRGFDRLQSAGFSEEDIASIRRQFHSESSNSFPDADLDGDDCQCIVDSST